LDWLSADLLAPAVYALIGGLITLAWKTRGEELRDMEAGLRPERRRLYSEILDPFITMMSVKQDASRQAQAIKEITSVKYRKTVVELSLFAGDDVVRAYNEFMQGAYRLQSEGSKPDPVEFMGRYGRFLLAIRKSVGNGRSALDEWDMLRSLINDIDQVVERARTEGRIK
jgi:hypothetical protein